VVLIPTCQTDAVCGVVTAFEGDCQQQPGPRQRPHSRFERLTNPKPPALPGDTYFGQQLAQLGWAGLPGLDSAQARACVARIQLRKAPHRLRGCRGDSHATYMQPYGRSDRRRGTKLLIISNKIHLGRLRPLPERGRVAIARRDARERAYEAYLPNTATMALGWWRPAPRTPVAPPAITATYCLPPTL
jgi:hypothetical protein